jgi:ketosteroid isomerase-like protein
MSPEKNKALVRRFYEEIDKGNLEAMDELVAEDYVDHTPPPFPGLAAGREGLKQAFKIFWEATPGYHRIEDQTTRVRLPPGFRGCHCQARSACHRPVD